MKKIVVDSSSLITMSSSCILKMMKHLAEKENIKFMIPESVYYESVERPLKIKRFELNAVRIRSAVQSGYMETVKTTPHIKKTMNELSTVTANICSANGKKLRLINLGEAETLALMKEIDSRILLIDERTTRMLIEEPENVMSFLERRHKCKVTLNKGEMSNFRNFFNEIRVIRSVELIALAYEDGAFEQEIPKSKQALEAALFAAKYAGCSVSGSEIKEFLRGVKN
tara:strand:+ start:5663 stop:6343 length:681 start_codon:yes stop_codon:yes gene_type:complete